MTAKRKPALAIVSQNDIAPDADTDLPKASLEERQRRIDSINRTFDAADEQLADRRAIVLRKRARIQAALGVGGAE